MTPVDVVLIGRNEGARLVAALEAVRGEARQIVYVDSGSTDTSIAEAESRGATVVQLDMSVPFTAARARNAGFEALNDPQFVQFIDGDCMLVPGYIEAARTFLENNPSVGMVTGWRSEIQPEASVYNRLCHWEWRRPAGVIMACGGDMMVRAALWRDVGGMNPRVIAAEDDEICCRFRKAGSTLARIPREMTRHDAAMLTFGQWWARAVRTGHGFAQVGYLHRDYFVTERKRVWIYGFILPLLFLLGLVAFPPLCLLVLAAYAWNWNRSVMALRNDGMENALKPGFLIMLSKIPNMIGMATYHWRRLSGAEMRLIEYK